MAVVLLVLFPFLRMVNSQLAFAARAVHRAAVHEANDYRAAQLAPSAA